MDEFLRYVVQQLAAHPGEAMIDHRRVDGRCTCILSLKTDDIGRLIGKGGSTIKAIRDLMSASGEKQGTRVSLEIVEL